MTALNPQVVDIYGQPFGTTLAELDAVWFAFAVGAWAVTIFLYRLIRRHLPPNTALEPTATILAVGSHSQIHTCGLSRRGSALGR